MGKVRNRVIMLLAALMLLTVVKMQACASFGPAQSIDQLKAATLPSGQKVVVALEKMGGFASGKSFRFEVLDAKTGERLHRLTRWFFQDYYRSLAFLGGAGARQWWSAYSNTQVMLIDVATGEWIADRDALIAKNPELHGELHLPPTDNHFYSVDPATNELIARGGAGQLFAIDPQTLKARLYTGDKSKMPPLPSQYFSVDSRGPAPTDVVKYVSPSDGKLVQTCPTISHTGACGLEWLAPDNTVRWTLSNADLHGDNFFKLQDIDDNTIYLSFQNYGFMNTLLGGSYAYAIETLTGKIRWRAKL